MKKVEIKCKGADTLPIDKILEFQGELKTLSKGNEKKLRNSILKFGFIAPFFVWDDKGEWRLLDGHQRLKTLLKMREEGYDIPLLPVDYIEADSEEDAKRKLLHITSQYGEFSPEGFENFTLDLDGFENIRITDVEFDISFLRDKNEAKDDNYEIPDEIETDIKVGDIFQIGEHRLMCGDSTDAEMVAKLMDGQKADVVVTDPPYNTGMKPNKDKKARLSHMFNDSMTDTEWNKFLLDIFNVYNRNTKGECVYYVFIDWRKVSDIRNALEVIANVKNIIVWDKQVHGLGSDYKSTYELCVVGKKGKPEIHNRYGLDYQDIWRVKRKMGRNKDHATAKPVEIISKPILHASKEDDIVLDLVLGSGTTMVAAHQLGRKCYGMELDPKYCQVIIDRMRALDGTIEIRRNGELYD